MARIISYIKALFTYEDEVCWQDKYIPQPKQHKQIVKVETRTVDKT